MTPHDFIRKWRGTELKERTASQSHFNDLCALLGVLDPIDADPTGEWYAFEKGATKTGGGEGWADVWRRYADEGWLASDASGVSLSREGLLRVDGLLPAFFEPEHQGVRYT